VKVSLLAPTLNEVEAVTVVLPKIDRHVVHEIIVPDAGSTDGTVEFCQQNDFPLFRQKTKGYGAALKEAIERATGDFIIEFPPDGNSMPEHIIDIVNKLNEGYDLVIASRYVAHAKSYDDDFITAIGNWLFTRMANLLFGSSFTDVLIGFRGYRKSAYQQLTMTAEGLSWSIQLPIQFFKHGFKIIDIPIDEADRIGGVRKMKPFRTGWEILKVLLKERIRGKNASSH